MFCHPPGCECRLPPPHPLPRATCPCFRSAPYVQYSDVGAHMQHGEVGRGLLRRAEEPHARAATPHPRPRQGDIAACRGTGRHTTEPADSGRTACPTPGITRRCWARSRDAQEDGSGARPPGCGASIRLPTSPASRQRSAAQECIDAWSDHASSYWLGRTDDTPSTHAYHGAYQHIRWPSEPLDHPATVENVPCIGERCARVGGAVQCSAVPRGRMAWGCVRGCAVHLRGEESYSAAGPNPCKADQRVVTIRACGMHEIALIVHPPRAARTRRSRSSGCPPPGPPDTVGRRPRR